MPYAPMKPCKYPGCAKMRIKGSDYCAQHKKEVWKDGRRTGDFRGMYNARWRRESKEFLMTHPVCVYCMKKGIMTRAQVVDHIRAHRGDPGLFWDRENWQALCVKCHNLKTRNGG